MDTELYLQGMDLRNLPTPEVLAVVRKMIGVLSLLRDTVRQTATV